MLNPLAILSALNAGTSILNGVINGIEGIFVGNTAGQNTFANILGSGLQNQGNKADLQSLIASLNQNGATDLQASGAGSLINLEQQGQLSDETLQSLNELISGNGTKDIQALSETNDDSENGLIGKKLDDPFGIKAAQSNGSPIAVPTTSPIDYSNITPAVSSENEDVANNIATQSIDNKVQTQAGAIATAKLDEKASLLKAKQTNNREEKQIIENLQTSIKNGEKISDLKSSLSNQAISEKIAERTNNQIHNPNVAFLVNQSDLSKNTDIIKNIRTKEELKDKLAEIDTYKIAHVTKKDNILDLRLEPEQLGKVQIKFDFGSDGKANISVIADKQSTLDLIQKDTKSIEKILNDNGVKTDSGSMSFNLSQQQKQFNDGVNFFAGKPLSFRVEEQIGKIANDNTTGNIGYIHYNNAGQSGMLNILV